MRIALLVARHEFLTHLRRRSFLFTTALLPAGGLLLGALGGAGGGRLPGDLAADLGMRDLRRVRDTTRVGYVDPGGFVRRLPPEDDDHYLPFPDEAAAREALGKKAVDVVYFIGPDYPQDPTVVRLSPGILFAADDRGPLYGLLRANLWPAATAQDLRDLSQPGLRLQVEAVAGGEPVADENPLRLLAPVVLAALLYSSIFMSSSFLLQSVTTEKESRLVEILLASVEPLELLAGKVVGLGLLGLVQIAVWASSGLVLANAGTAALVAGAAVALRPELVALGAAYFLLGYVFYASLMGAVGALVPTFQDSGPLTFAILFPAWLPFFVLQSLLESPHGVVARAFSLLPPTAPLVMLLRVASGGVPAWEVAASLALLGVGSVAVLALAARLFRASVLLGGRTPRPIEVWRLLRAPGRAPRAGA